MYMYTHIHVYPTFSMLYILIRIYMCTLRLYLYAYIYVYTTLSMLYVLIGIYVCRIHLVCIPRRLVLALLPPRQFVRKHLRAAAKLGVFMLLVHSLY